MSETGGLGGFRRIEQLAARPNGLMQVSGIAESRSAAIASHIIKTRGGQVLLLTASYGRAKRLAEDLSFFVEPKVYLLPEEERSLMAYDAKSHHNLVGRLSAITPLAKGEDAIVVASIRGALKKIAPKDLFVAHHIRLEVGKTVDLSAIKQSLAYMGYERTGSVEAIGQFSLRGGILDVFPPDRDNPYRVELFDDEVDSIRTFDSETQRSLDSCKFVTIYPAEEIVQSDYVFQQAATAIQSAYTSFQKKLTGEKREKLQERLARVLGSMETGSNIQLLEQYIHYFYENPHVLWDYLSPNGVVIVEDPDRIRETLELAEKEYQEDFKTLLERGELVPEDYGAFSGGEQLETLYGDRNKTIFLFTPFQKQIKGADRLDDLVAIASKQATVFNGRMDFLEAELSRYVKQNYTIELICSTPERAENMSHFLQTCKLESKAKVRVGSLTGGMEFPEEKLVILCDRDIFVTVKQKKSRNENASSRGIKAFSDIRKGDFVVHENHGIGKFLGVVQLTVQGTQKDYLKVKYAGEDFLYVPVEQMDLIQKYVGADGINPKVNKLSGGEWKKTKTKAQAAIKDMAKDLIALSAARQLEQGYAFSKDNLWQREFEDRFPYEETADQLRCVREIKKDMEKPLAMDRLLCGDVGYGKTEVAARAVFKCIADGRQAAILVPTTLLANQHYYTFKERFEAFPFRVEMLSRFRSEGQQLDIIERTKRGEVDVLIGTHRLLSKDVSFKNLGLLVIDEEQRFGVQHKEAMKQLRKNVDVLTLSATPIPRTLHMSLIGIRDMSLIEEPPEERYPVQTYVLEQDNEILREAVERELDREGQVYVVYNRIHGIQKIASLIRELVPKATVAVAHGQMDEKQLEDIMLTFVDNRANVLVTTTIIESGLDIPNVNTMIIMDSDRYGLSQLYQLRGRVGRSNRMAYAYLMYQKNKVLTEQAEKRLRAIREFTEFGAGFHIAMRDLEIRGAGNLLGSEQHGHMMMIGYELYCKLVDDAVRELSDEEFRPKSEAETSVEIQVEAYIPDRYIEDERMKLQMYKKIASIEGAEDQQEIIDELLDRFGDIPKETLQLIDIALIKAMAQSAGVERIHQEQQKLVFHFDPAHKLNPEQVANVVGEYGMRILVHGGLHPFMKVHLQTNDRLGEAKAFLTKLSR